MRPVVIPSVLALVGLGAAFTAFVVFRPVAPPVPFLATQQARVRVVTLTDALVEPWALAFLPNGDILITQRGGRLRLMHQDRLAAGYVDGISPVDTRKQDGLMDLALHPRFAENRTIYFTSLTTGRARRHDGARERRFDGARLAGVRDLFVADAWSRYRRQQRLPHALAWTARST